MANRNLTNNFFRINQNAYSTHLPKYVTVLTESPLLLLDKDGNKLKDYKCPELKLDEASGDNVTIIDLGDIPSGTYTLLKNEKRLKIERIAEMTHLAEGKLLGAIENLIEDGLVEGVGSGKSRSYILSAKVYKENNRTMKKWYDEEYEFTVEVTGFLHGDHTERYCRNGEEIGDKYTCTYGCPVNKDGYGICSKTMMMLYPLMEAIRSGGDLENLGGESKYSKTVVCPDGCVIFKLTAKPLGNENFHKGGFWDYPDETI